MKIAFNPSTVAALTTPPNNKDITFDLRGQNIFARGVKFCGTDTNTWRDIKINNVSIGSHTLDLRNGSNTTLTNTNGVVTINSTWRPVVDNLTSDSTTSSLSAKQGKVLKALIDGKSDSEHNHDGRYVRYYTVTTLDCNNLASGLTVARVNATNAASTYHSAYLYISDVGTPFQIQIPDSDTSFIYKRYYSSGKWSGWFKLNAGYADSAGSVAWANVTNKPATATRWPSWAEVTGKPSSFTPADHNHDNKYLRWLGNAGQSNMNAIGRISHSSGMTALSDPGNTIDNPMEGSAKSTSWHLYWQTNYTDTPSGSNAWVAQIVNRAGTDRWWVRSRSGGTITNGTGWTSNWRFLVTAPTSGLGNGNQPIYINSAGEVVAANSYPTSLKSPHSLTLKANGTTLAVYDGSSIKEANFTYANVGAASASHNHDERYVYNYGGIRMDGASVGKNALGMTTNSGVTGDWWHILQAAWNGEYRWNSQIAFPTQNRNGMYYRSGLDDDAKWGSWVKLLDTNNYSGVLDSRYYTESEVNSLLGAKLNRQNLSYGTWNPRGYNLAADYSYNGGDLSISENSGKIYVSIDGQFYQNEGQYRVLDTSDVAGLKGDLTVHQYLYNTDTTWWPLIWGGSSHANTSDSTGAVYKSHDKLSWQTSSQTLYATHLKTTYIDLENSRGISQVTSKGTSPYKGIRLPDLQSNGIGMFSKIGGGSGADEGGIIISADTSVIYNSFDTGWGLTVRDKDRGQTDISGDGTIAFGVRQDYRAYSLGGFEKAGSNNSYVLLGGGGHKLESSLNVANANTISGYDINHLLVKRGRLGDYNIDHETTFGTRDIQPSSEITISGKKPFDGWGTLLVIGSIDGASNQQLAFTGNNRMYIRCAYGTSNNYNTKDWATVALTSDNVASATNAYHLRINSVNTWSTWYWAGQGGQPSWLWGSNDGTNMYVWNPNNFNVNTARYLRSLGDQNCQTGRIQAYGDVYTYNTYNGNTGSPSTYTSVIGFGRGIRGTVEIAGGWCNTHLYWRSLRDCCEDWYSWRTVLDSSNYTEFINNYYWANVKISASSSTTTSPTVHTLTATRVCAGHDPGIDNSISCSNWFRSSGNTGWYNTTYQGGWYMSDTSWIRTHNGVGIYTSGQIYSSSSIKMSDIYLEHTNEVNSASGIHLNYRNSSNISLCQGGGNVGIGTTTPSYKLDVNGQMRASGFIHSDHSINDAVLLAGGGYERIFKLGTTRYYNNTSYELSFHKLSGLCNNLVWVDGCIWNSTSISFQLSSDFYPYLYANSPSMRTIYRMDGNNMITVDGNGIVIISCSSYPRRVGFFYTGRA